MRIRTFLTVVVLVLCGTAASADASPPQLRFVYAPLPRSTSHTLMFLVEATEPVSGYEALFDGRWVAMPDAALTLAQVPNGPHALSVWATDLSGNRSEQPLDWFGEVGDDADGDRLFDTEELLFGTDPHDADTDDDGVPDGAEITPAADTDGDGLIDARDPDADDDGLLDGTEMGVIRAGPDTDLAAGHFRPDLDPATTTNPISADSDGGGVKDGAEDGNGNGRWDRNESNPAFFADDHDLLDSDGDGLPDPVEALRGTLPNDADTDDDGLKDGEESNPTLDTDGDGRPNPLDPDSDGDLLFDGTERGVASAGFGTSGSAGNFVPDRDPSTRTGVLSPDTDGGGLVDGLEDGNRDGRKDRTERDPSDPSDDPAIDSDGDGLSDAAERRLGGDPADRDSDDDGLADGAEPQAWMDTDGDGLPNLLDPDSDDDGLLDGTEAGLMTPDRDTDLSRRHFVPDADPSTRTNGLSPDTDGGGRMDGTEDANHDGRLDPGEGNPLSNRDDAGLVDTDRDGLTDREEALLGTDPNEADTDRDGLPDGRESNRTLDSDGDGRLNATDRDADGDGLMDGTEAGIAGFDADPTRNTFVLRSDSDGGGVVDGLEDKNRNGRFDPGEGDPGRSEDDPTADGDRDGLPDAVERFLGTSPSDPDSDDDGVKDGAERQAGLDDDGDGLVNALDPDSDDDGLFDGTELGLYSPGPGTDLSKGHFVADADWRSRTNPLAADTDGDGLLDGAEDASRNGRLDGDETDPLDAASRSPDADADGLPDGFERDLGSDPNDADTDDDGVPDGEEANPALDADGDGLPNPVDPDSDGDGLGDGTECGRTTAGPATDRFAGRFIPDQDPSTRTCPLIADTDRGGAVDGAEDLDRDGKVEPGETDPGLEWDDRRPLDGDGDGVADAADDCPLVADAGQADADGDGTGDACDPDADGDGLDDALVPGGGGCKTAGFPTWTALGMLLMARRRRGRTGEE